MAAQDTQQQNTPAQQNLYQQVGGRAVPVGAGTAGENGVFAATPEQHAQYQKIGNILQPGINTNTPSGTQAQNAPPNPATAGGALTGQDTPTASGILPTADQYKQTLANLQASGTQAPDTQGAATATIQQNAPLPAPPPYDPTKADAVIKDDKAHQQLIDDHTAFQNSANLTQSLTQEYATMSKQLGLPALNTQLINMKAIMDGTEQDIRNEITKAGGFATESQVQALTNARNKTQIASYHNLLQTRDDAQKNIDTMIGLSKEDRAYAKQKVDEQLNFDTQQIQYADKMLANAQSSLDTNGRQNGWDTVYRAAVASGDIHAIARINSTMGNGFDLATMAQNDLNSRNAAIAQAALKTQETQSVIDKNKADVTNMAANTDRANRALNETISHNQATEAENKVKDANTLTNQTAINERANKTLNETIAHNQATEAENKVRDTNTAIHNAAVELDTKTKNVETARHNKEMESIAARKAKGGGLGDGLSIKDYVTTSSKGSQYVDLSTVTDKAEKKAVETAARNAGIGVVTDANAGKMNAIEDTRNNLDNIQTQFDKIGYSSGATKAVGGLGFGLSNRIADFFGDTNVGSFKAWRTAAINSVQALAGGTGSGLRINAAEIAAATENDIPNISDTVAVGKAKMDVLRSQLDGWEHILTGSKDRSSGAKGGSKGGDKKANDPLGLGI